MTILAPSLSELKAENAKRAASHEAFGSTKAGNRNALTLELQKRWLKLECSKPLKQARSESLATLIEKRRIIPIFVLCLLASYGLAQITVPLLREFIVPGKDSPGIWVLRQFISGVIIGVPFFLTMFALFQAIARKIVARLRNSPERHNDKVNAWWQDVDRHFRRSGLPGVYRPMCVFGPRVILDDGSLVRVESYNDGVWVVKGWSTFMTVREGYPAPCERGGIATPL